MNVSSFKTILSTFSRATSFCCGSSGGHLNFFRDLSSDVTRAISAGENSKSSTNSALESVQRACRTRLAQVTVPLFSPAQTTGSGSLSPKDAVALTLAVRTVQRRWSAAHALVFQPYKAAAVSGTSSAAAPQPATTATSGGAHSMRHDMEPPTSSPMHQFPISPQEGTAGVAAADAAPPSIQRAPPPRTFSELRSGPGDNSTSSSHGSSSCSSSANHVSEEVLEHWASYSTWLCSLGGLRAYNTPASPLQSGSCMEAAAPAAAVFPRTTHLHWVVERDMARELLEAYPFGSARPHPHGNSQRRVDHVISDGLGAHLSPNLTLHLFTQLHRCLGATRDQRSGDVATEEPRTGRLVFGVLSCLKQALQRHRTGLVAAHIAGSNVGAAAMNLPPGVQGTASTGADGSSIADLALQQPMDEVAVATLEALLLGAVPVVKELTVCLEAEEIDAVPEASRRRTSSLGPAISRADCALLRSTFADVVLAMLDDGISHAMRGPSGMKKSSLDIHSVHDNDGRDNSGSNDNERSNNNKIHRSNDGKTRPCVCAVSDDFKHQMVSTLFAWLYHSGTTGRFCLLSDATDASSTTPMQTGPSPSISSPSAQVLHHASSSSSSSSSSNTVGSTSVPEVPLKGRLAGSDSSVSSALPGFALELLYMQALEVLLKGLELKPVTDVHATGKVFSGQETGQNSRAHAASGPPLMSAPHLSSGASSDRTRRQRDQMFRTYFLTLERLLATAGSASAGHGDSIDSPPSSWRRNIGELRLGDGKTSSSISDSSTASITSLLEETCTAALAHLVGNHLDIGFRKAIAAAERSDWLDGVHEPAGQASSEWFAHTNPSSSKSSNRNGEGGSPLRTTHSPSESLNSPSGCFLDMFVHLLAGNAPGLQRALTVASASRSHSRNLALGALSTSLSKSSASHAGNNEIQVWSEGESVGYDERLEQLAALLVAAVPSYPGGTLGKSKGYIERTAQAALSAVAAAMHLKGHRLLLAAFDASPYGRPAQLFAQHTFTIFLAAEEAAIEEARANVEAEAAAEAAAAVAATKAAVAKAAAAAAAQPLVGRDGTSQDTGRRTSSGTSGRGQPLRSTSPRAATASARNSPVKSPLTPPPTFSARRPVRGRGDRASSSSSSGGGGGGGGGTAAVVSPEKVLSKPTPERRVSGVIDDDQLQSFFSRFQEDVPENDGLNESADSFDAKPSSSSSSLVPGSAFTGTRAAADEDRAAALDGGLKGFLWRVTELEFVRGSARFRGAVAAEATGAPLASTSNNKSNSSKSLANVSVFGDESAGTEFILLYLRHVGSSYADALARPLLCALESTAAPEGGQKDLANDEVDSPLTPNEAGKDVMLDEIDSPLTPNAPGKEVALDEVDSPLTPAGTNQGVGLDEATPEEAGGMSLAQLREALEAGELTEEEFTMLAEEASEEAEKEADVSMPAQQPLPVAVTAADTSLLPIPGEFFQFEENYFSYDSLHKFHPYHVWFIAVCSLFVHVSFSVTNHTTPLGCYRPFFAADTDATARSISGTTISFPAQLRA